MSLVRFDFSEKNKSIEIIGKDFDINSLKLFLDLLYKVNKKNNLSSLKIIGNFDTKFLLNTFFFDKNNKTINETLNLFQSISIVMEESNIFYSSEINGLVQGPALEISLLCNYIFANDDTILKLDQTDYGITPFFGTIQRLTRLIGYQEALKALLIDKELTYNQGLKLDLFNNKIDNSNKIREKKTFWDQDFTNTFIFYNSKIHSKYKNQKPQYNAILSTIFESSVCHSDVGLSIEKRWLKWLLMHENFNHTT